MQSVREIYDSRIHGKYYRPTPAGRIPRRYLSIVNSISSFGPNPLQRIVEVGSESPSIPEFWEARLGLRRDAVALVEISRASERLLTAAGFSVTLGDVSNADLPFETHSVSVVIMSEVIEHLTDPDHALEEIRRILTPRGLLVLTTPNLAAWTNRVSLLLGWQPLFTETGTEWVFGRVPPVPVSRPVGHLHVFTLGALKGLLAYHGFAIREVVGLPIEVSPVRNRLILGFDRLLARFPALASGLLIAGSPAATDSPVSQPVAPGLEA